MTRELDDLMNLDPLELSDQDIDEIIAYQRKAQGLHDDGKKAAKGNSKPVDLVGLGLIKAQPTMKRPGGI
jgi:hypothetical protein